MSSPTSQATVVFRREQTYYVGFDHSHLSCELMLMKSDDHSGQISVVLFCPGCGDVLESSFIDFTDAESRKEATEVALEWEQKFLKAINKLADGSIDTDGGLHGSLGGTTFL
jgi:hypothetical protein